MPRVGRSKGRPLEEGSRPTINGLFANLSTPLRNRAPSPKKCLLTDDVFVAQAELRALEALNSKLASEVCAIEKRSQQMEIDRHTALSECESLRERERILREQVANARRDAAKAGADAIRLEEEMRRAASARVAADERVKEVVEAGQQERRAWEIDSREIIALKRDLANALRVAAEREREIELLQSNIKQSQVDRRDQTGELAQLREDNRRLQENVETEKAWREQAQRDAADAVRCTDKANAACAQAKEIIVRLRRTSKVAISEASAVRDEYARLKREAPEGARLCEAPESATDWRRRCMEGRERETFEKKRAGVLYHQLKAERDRTAKADKDVSGLKVALDRAQRAVRHERQRVNRLQRGINHPVSDEKRRRSRRNDKDDGLLSFEKKNATAPPRRESQSAGAQALTGAAVIFPTMIKPPPPPLPLYSDVPCFLRDDEDEDEVNRAVRARYHDDMNPARPSGTSASKFEAREAFTSGLSIDESKICADLDKDIPLCFRDDSGDDDFDFKFSEDED